MGSGDEKVRVEPEGMVARDAAGRIVGVVGTEAERERAMRVLKATCAVRKLDARVVGSGASPSSLRIGPPGEDDRGEPPAPAEIRAAIEDAHFPPVERGAYAGRRGPVRMTVVDGRAFDDCGEPFQDRHERPQERCGPVGFPPVALDKPLARRRMPEASPAIPVESEIEIRGAGGIMLDDEESM